MPRAGSYVDTGLVEQLGDSHRSLASRGRDGNIAEPNTTIGEHGTDHARYCKRFPRAWRSAEDAVTPRGRTHNLQALVIGGINDRDDFRQPTKRRRAEPICLILLDPSVRDRMRCEPIIE